MASLIAHTRIFVALTLAEAAAIGRLPPGPDPDAISAVAKIRTALAGVRAPTGETLPLRAKYYVAPHGPKLRMASVDPPRRMAKAAIATSPAPEDDYVPFRDEADGRWR